MRIERHKPYKFPEIGPTEEQTYHEGYRFGLALVAVVVILWIVSSIWLLR